MQRSEQIAVALVRRIEEYETVLRGGVALFLASDEVTRSEFHDYYRHLELNQHYPGILGIGFAKLLRSDDVPGLEARVREEGYTSCAVHPTGSHGWQTPIVLIEPFAGPNQRAFGFDMFSEHNRRVAIERAWQTGRASMSASVRLVQDRPDDAQPGFLIYLPVFRLLETTPWEPQRTPSGFV